MHEKFLFRQISQTTTMEIWAITYSTRYNVANSLTRKIHSNFPYKITFYLPNNNGYFLTQEFFAVRLVIQSLNFVAWVNAPTATNARST